MNSIFKQHAPFGMFRLSEYHCIKAVGCSHDVRLLLEVPAEFLFCCTVSASWLLSLLIFFFWHIISGLDNFN